MKFEQINHIIFFDAKASDFDGKYNLKFSHHELEYNGEKFKYHNSGLCRNVFISEDKTFVIKVPVPDGDLYLGPNDLDDLKWKFLHWSAQHNILEYLAYEQCPEDLKPYFAKTELLDHGWIKQEYVEVFKVNYSYDLRELGRKKDGQICLFDYDPIIGIESYCSPFRNTKLEDIQFARHQFEKIVKIIENHETGS